MGVKSTKADLMDKYSKFEMLFSGEKDKKEVVLSYGRLQNAHYPIYLQINHFYVKSTVKKYRTARSLQESCQIVARDQAVLHDRSGSS